VNNKYIFIIWLLLVLHLESTVSREYKVDNNGIILSATFQFEERDKKIEIYCILENNTEEIIYVTDKINSNWNATVKLDSLEFYKYSNYKSIGSIIIPNVMLRLYELKPSKKKNFIITVIFDSENYDDQIVQDFPLILEYFLYGEEIPSILKTCEADQISLEDDQFFIMNSILSFNKRSLNLNLNFMGRIRN
jgi:hypothetical protein